MRQFQVPQFITVEDKVIGPFTIKQFVYLAGGGIVIFLSRMVLLPYVFVPLAIVVGVMAATLAFLKINEVPFPVVLKRAFVFYLLKPRLYLWKKEKAEKKGGASAKPGTVPQVNEIPKLSASRLSELAWSLDIKERRREEEE